MTGPLLLSLHSGVEGALAQGGVLAVVVAATWAIHAWRMRRLERDLMRLVDERTADWRNEAEAHARLARGVWGAAGEAPGEEDTADDDRADAADESGSGDGQDSKRVLAVAAQPVRAALASRLTALGFSLAGADSVFSARVACRDALAAGQPYDLVLVDAALARAEGLGDGDRLDDELHACGSPVAFVRASDGCLQEGGGVR